MGFAVGLPEAGVGLSVMVLSLSHLCLDSISMVQKMDRKPKREGWKWGLAGGMAVVGREEKKKTGFGLARKGVKVEILQAEIH